MRLTRRGDGGGARRLRGEERGEGEGLRAVGFASNGAGRRGGVGRWCPSDGDPAVEERERVRVEGCEVERARI